jgi:glycyl-tRNA synthetase beta chain
MAENQEYVFELLTEEIPAWMHTTMQSNLRQQLVKLLTTLGVEEAEKSVTVHSTSRRIAFLLSRLPLQEADRDEEVKGPPKKIAWESDGLPTRALLGFLKKNSAEESDIAESGDYLVLRKRVAGRSIASVLQERIPAIIEGIRWPKMMRWGKGEYAYIRPIHSVISILACQPLPLAIFGVASGMTTDGHRTLAPGSIEVTSFDDYVSKLELARVVLDGERRLRVMAERSRILAREVDGTPAVDETIWSQWQYLTEFPGIVRAEFRPEYRDLPEEVLVTVMRVHQKQLPIRDAQGKLTNYFLGVIDNDGDPDGNAAYGNSFVTNARFADAKFFYETDRRTPLADRLEALSHLQFQEKLGNYRDKTERIVRIVTTLCADLGIDAADAVHAARLAKTDLGTEMVKEFTDLQGKVGGIYAREEGLAESVWMAIYDHYLPLNLEDSLPRNVAGGLVSLADKIDTLTGFFVIGAKPTGSKDPFALRRAAQGVVQILLDRDRLSLKLGIERLIDVGLAVHGHGETASAAARNDLLAFFAERVRTLLEAAPHSFAYDEVAAAMAAGWSSSLNELVDRTAAVRAMRNDPNFLKILDSAKRIENITAGHQSTRVDSSKLEGDVERRLDQLATVVTEQIEEMVAEKRYVDALESFAALAPELETFFSEVMVMVEDAGVRENRMSLLRKVGDSAKRIADVTKIVIDRSDYR